MIHKNIATTTGLRRTATLLAATYLLMMTAQAADDLTQPIRVSPDGHFLAQPDGKPFFWLADTGWVLFQRLNREEADQYLQDRARKGFTVIQAVAFGLLPVTTPNRYGELALIDKDPTRPNPKYFEHVDWVVNRAAHYGLRIAMVPTWGASVIGGYLDDGKQRIFNPGNAEVYGRWIGVRYRNKGVIWILGGDTNPLGITAFDWDKKRTNLTIIDYRPVYDAMAKGIIAGDGGTPVISYHISCCNWLGTAQPRTSLYLGDRDWLTINMLQSSHFRDPTVIMRLVGVKFAWNGTFNYEPIRDEYDAQPTRPIIDGEPRYEDLAVDVESDSKLIEAKSYWAAYDVRNAAYHAVFAGAAGHTYGNHSVWQFYDPAHFRPVQGARGELPWQKAILQPGAGQMQLIKALMLSRPYFTRIPDQSVVIGDAGRGESHIGATRDRAGSYAMVFVPKGQPVTVDLSKITGLHAVAWWFDPRTGATTRIAGSFATTGPTTFTPPTSGPESDWVLVVDDESKGFGAPGAKP